MDRLTVGTISLVASRWDEFFVNNGGAATDCRPFEHENSSGEAIDAAARRLDSLASHVVRGSNKRAVLRTRATAQSIRT